MPVRPHDYLYHYRCDQDMIGQNDVAQLAQKHNVDITTWVTATGSILGTDGMEHIETESSIGVTYTEEYRELPKAPPSCLSVPTTRSLAKRSTLLPALVPMFSMTTGGSSYLSGGDVTHLTNMVTEKPLTLRRQNLCHTPCCWGATYWMTGIMRPFLAGLTGQWQEDYVLFNVTDVKPASPLPRRFL